MTEVDRILADPAAVLSVPTNDLFCLLPPRSFQAYLKEAIPGRPQMADNLSAIGAAFAGSGITALGAAFSVTAKRAAHQRALLKTNNNAFRFVVARSAISFTEKEKTVFRGAAQLTMDRAYTPQHWNRFLTLMIWNGAKAHLEPLPDFANHKTMEDVRNHFRRFLQQTLPDHDTFLAEAAADISNAGPVASLARPAAPTPAQTSQRQSTPINPASTGAHWMSYADAQASSYYDTSPNPASLTLGYHPDNDQPIYFSGHESLITIGGPGSGKSQALVIPNLLTYAGSAIVLDVKGELFAATAGHRARHFGPVYRFSPTEPGNHTHRYNPFDFISTEPAQAAIDCSVLAFQIIPDNPNNKDPYWEGRGRDYLWAFATLIAVRMPPNLRNMESLAEAITLPLDKKPDSDLCQILSAMRQLGTLEQLPDLVAAANTYENALITSAKTLESVLDTIRRYVTPFTRSPSFMRAMSTSDWTPQQLRRRPGTTLYICLSPTELKTYASIIRLLLAQHSRDLQAYAAIPKEPPITFFLDEMPQLGNFESILEVQDVGRGAGLRLWMFAQTLGQLSAAFGRDRYLGVVDACRVRAFLQPEDEASKLISPALGEIRNLFNGEKRPLATPDELMGRAFHDKTIVTTRGDLPMNLNKKYAWQHYTNLPSPPNIPVAPPPKS